MWSQLFGVVLVRLGPDASAVRFSRHAKNEMRLYGITRADAAAVIAALTVTGTDVRADYDSKANAISITLAPAEHAERADQVHERAIVALHDGHPVELQLLYPDLGVEEPIAAVADRYDLDRAALETLPNRETKERLGRLAAELDRLATGDTPARPTVPALRSRHYPASVAVMEVLSDAGTAMRPCEVHVAVETRLGRPVPRATVKSFLLYGSRGEAATLERVSGGRYQLGRHGPRQPSRERRLDAL